MYLRDSKTKSVNAGNTIKRIKTAAEWRPALMFIKVFHLHRSLITLTINDLAHGTRFSGRLWILISLNIHSCYTIVAFILVDVALVLIGFAACSLLWLAMALYTDGRKWVVLSLMMHQYEKLIFLDIALSNIGKHMSNIGKHMSMVAFSC